jgi:hypothetical protein
MGVNRARLNEIVELAGEAEIEWARKPRTSSLAFWLRQVTQAVIALDDGQERLESDLGAMSDVVDQKVDSDPDFPEPQTLEEIVAELVGYGEPEDEGTLNLPEMPYVVDYDLAYDEACFVDGLLHVGSLFVEMWKAAAADAESQTD